MRIRMLWHLIDPPAGGGEENVCHQRPASLWLVSSRPLQIDPHRQTLSGPCLLAALFWRRQMDGGDLGVEQDANPSHLGSNRKNRMGERSSSIEPSDIFEVCITDGIISERRISRVVNLHSVGPLVRGVSVYNKASRRGR